MLRAWEGAAGGTPDHRLATGPGDALLQLGEVREGGVGVAALKRHCTTAPHISKSWREGVTDRGTPGRTAQHVSMGGVRAAGGCQLRLGEVLGGGRHHGGQGRR